MMMPDDDQHCLRLLRVGKGAGGLLACEVSNRHGTAHCTLRLCLAGRCPCTGGATSLCWGVASPYGAPSLHTGVGVGEYCPMVPHALVPGEDLPHSMTLLLSASHAYVVGMLLYRVISRG